MSIRNLFSLLLIVAGSFTFTARVFTQPEWAVEKTFHVGGEGGFDYITVDAKSQGDASDSRMRYWRQSPAMRF